MKNFRTYDLAVEFYENCQVLKLKGPIKNQFARASLSIPLNLAEGSARPTARDRRKFYRIALGSQATSAGHSPQYRSRAHKLTAHLICNNKKSSYPQKQVRALPSLKKLVSQRC